MIYSDRYKVEQYVLSPDPTGTKPSMPKTTSKTESSPFIEDCHIKIHKMDKKNMEIDFVGFHFSLINAYRRIVLAEVATVAIEKVYMYKNTSVVQDEVLAHRIGLVPLNVPPHLFNFKPAGYSRSIAEGRRIDPDEKDEDSRKKVQFSSVITYYGGQQDSDQYTEDNCVKYKLRVKCRGKKDSRLPAVQNEDDVDTTLVDKLVTTDDLEWVPLGNQATVFADNPLTPLKEEVPLPPQVKPCNTSLVLAKLKPGQRLLLEAYAFKGIGSDHAKFQPGLCWYRMLPEVKLTRPVLGDDALKLQKCFSPGVIEVVTNDEGENEARVLDARYDSCSRNVFNVEELKDAVELSRNAKHIIFNVESHSVLKSYEILDAAVDVLISKCDTLLEQLDSVEED